MNILIVEDDKGVALLFQFVLQGAGHTAQVWTSDFEAVAKVAPWDLIDVVIADQQLGEYDGKELLRWVSDNRPSVRRVMITGSSLTNEIEASADVVLIKPVSAGSILDSLSP